MSRTSEVDTLECDAPDLEVVLSHPRERPTKGIVVYLEDKECSAPSIRVSYDFEHDGWLIERPALTPLKQLAPNAFVIGRSTWKEAGFVSSDETTRDPAMDYVELMKKYLAHLHREEGSTNLHGSTSDFLSDVELAEMRRLDAEVRREQGWD